MRLGKFDIKYNNEREFRIIKKEVWIQQVYGGIKLMSQNPLVIDIGAHIGIATLFFASYYPTSKVFAVEALSENFALLEENIVNNDLSGRVKTANIACGSKDGFADFYYHGETNIEKKWLSNAGFLPGSWKGSQISSKTTVNTTTIDNIIAQALIWAKVKIVDLIKIDIEGAEIGVVKASRFDSNTVKNIVIETHQTEHKITKLFAQKGYVQESRNVDEELVVAKYCSQIS